MPKETSGGAKGIPREMHPGPGVPGCTSQDAPPRRCIQGPASPGEVHPGPGVPGCTARDAPPWVTGICLSLPWRALVFFILHLFECIR